MKDTDSPWRKIARTSDARDAPSASKGAKRRSFRGAKKRTRTEKERECRKQERKWRSDTRAGFVALFNERAYSAEIALWPATGP